LKLYNRILDDKTYLIAEALPEIVSIYERENATADLEVALRALLKKNPEMNALVAYTAIVNDLGGIPVIDQCVEEYMLNEPTLGEFVELQQLSAGDTGSNVAALAKIRGALSKLANTTPRYQCQECGFSSQRLLWQCPSCRNWETQRPASRVQFDTVLQHSITNR
jgi:lipopolysaccharide biosynthesis regulator YciM